MNKDNQICNKIEKVKKQFMKKQCFIVLTIGWKGCKAALMLIFGLGIGMINPKRVIAAG